MTTVDEKYVPFSKRYFEYLVVLEFFVIVFIGVMVILSGDVTPLYWVISTLAAEISVYSAFYLWKSKNENRSKYAQLYVNDIADKYGIDIAIRIAEVVLKE